MKSLPIEPFAGLRPGSLFWIAACWLMLSGSLAMSARADDPGPSPLRAFESNLVETIAEVERSVVSIARLPNMQPDSGVPLRIEMPPQVGQSLDSSFLPTDFGSGVIIAGDNGSDERFVLTAAHVVFGRRAFQTIPSEERLANTSLYVRLPTRHIVAAELLAADHRSDLAVLRLPLAAAGIPAEAAPPIRFGDGLPLKKGRLVIALGNPYAIARDGSASASIGMVSNLSRRPWPPRGVLSDPTESDLTIHHYGTLLHVDTRLSLGASGGALVDLQGHLVGLTTSMAALEGYEKSVGYAVQIDRAAMRIIDSLRQGFEVEYGFLGVQPGAADGDAMSQFRDLTRQASAASIRRVAPHSPAELAGLRPNDIVLSVDGVEVYSDVDLVREVGWLGPDATALLSVLRPDANRVLSVECRLGKWPVYDESLSITTRDRYPDWRGLHTDFPTARKRYLPANPLLTFPQGVVVTHVDPGSPAAEAGLAEGQFVLRVDGQAVMSPKEFQAAVANAASDVLLMMSDGRSLNVKPDAVP